MNHSTTIKGTCCCDNDTEYKQIGRIVNAMLLQQSNQQVRKYRLNPKQSCWQESNDYGFM